MTLRSRIAYALAERDGLDIGITRIREKLEDHALTLMAEWGRAPREPASPLEEILEEGRLAVVAREAERHANRAMIEDRFAAQRQAVEPAPDDDHRFLILTDSLTGGRFRVRFHVDDLEAIGHHPAEAAREAAGRRYVPKATSAA